MCETASTIFYEIDHLSRSQTGTRRTLDRSVIDELAKILNPLNSLSNILNLSTIMGFVKESINTDEKNLNFMMAAFNNMFKLRRPTEIRDFLEANDFLNPLVSEAHDQLQKYFPYSTIFMEVAQNELIISVGTSFSPEEADERLHNFDADWWIDESINSKAKLCITVEFQ
ncbi:MAG: hypothetical protein PHS80_05785 [Methanothrix sp.]|nr:hypothetical protein [Methanothrix sp.]MDD4446918.1 hypothetical protein [Methanothrix sp.]